MVAANFVVITNGRGAHLLEQPISTNSEPRAFFPRVAIGCRLLGGVLIGGYMRWYGVNRMINCQITCFSIYYTPLIVFEIRFFSLELAFKSKQKTENIHCINLTHIEAHVRWPEVGTLLIRWHKLHEFFPSRTDVTIIYTSISHLRISRYTTRRL